ncbi:MAG: TlpA family protein disulfide reductase [Bacteroidetes bacterium]|nr:MAG: TlpA family protein disulfide reductase [Bacteroidota bacterium]
MKSKLFYWLLLLYFPSVSICTAQTSLFLQLVPGQKFQYEWIEQNTSFPGERYLASSYSPDRADRSRPYTYGYERLFLNGKEEYTPAYFDILTQVGQKSKFLTSMAELAINQPGYYPKLKALFEETRPGQDFRQFFHQALDEYLPKIPEFQLEDLQGNAFGSQSLAQKWAFIDFWGTWCRPCVAEMPKLQELYEQEGENLTFMTIAYRDNREAVLNFMNRRGYSLPVCMSDGQVEGLFGVNSYPTKVLIMPSGHYVKIPFGSSSKEQIAQYRQFEF